MLLAEAMRRCAGWKILSGRGSMRYAAHTLVTVLIGLVFASFAFCQDAIMVMEHKKEIGPHERPLVHFNHEKHMEVVKPDCLYCHHDFDKYGNNVGGESAVQACSTCHSPGSGKNVVPLKEAFHGQCKGCHENARGRGYPSGPVTCGECHVRK